FLPVGPQTVRPLELGPLQWRRALQPQHFFALTRPVITRYFVSSDSGSGKPFIPVTTINMQTCQYRPTVPPVFPPSIPPSCPQSHTLDSIAMSPRPVALAWRPTLLSPR
ncbi:hypothetical protein XENOCAPTIV_006355, partial [Xenoophorus captivus]